ncbi:MAG: hypothetical protein ACRDZ9_02470 [Acidimicrobiales bacterium]
MFALYVVLSVLEIVLLVVTLTYFLGRISRLLKSISATLAKITFGVRAVESQCAVIGPAADRVNADLADAAAGLTRAAERAERLAR